MSVKEARILTVDEVRNIGANNIASKGNGKKPTYLWIEEYGHCHITDEAIIEWAKDIDLEPYDFVEVFYTRMDYDDPDSDNCPDDFDLDRYNETWRCWTSEPTDTQLKNTPWLEEV